MQYWFDVTIGRIKCLSLFILLMMLQSTGFSQQSDFASAKEIVSILRAKNVDEIKKATLNQKGYLIDLTSAYRAYELASRNAEKKLFMLLPRSSNQISILYSLTSLDSEKTQPELNKLYENYYKTIFALAPKYPQYFRQLFAIVSNYGGDMNVGEEEWFCDLLHDLYEKAPREYLHALAEEEKYRPVGINCAATCEDRQ